MLKLQETTNISAKLIQTADHVADRLHRDIAEILPERDDVAAASLEKNTPGASTAGVTQRPPLASCIEHTLLKPNAGDEDLRELCAEARTYNFVAVCVNSLNVPLCFRELEGSDVIVCSVIGFPLGASSTAAKAYEAGDAVRNGAQEVDMVIDLGALKEQDYARMHDDIHGVVAAAAPARVKVIIETGLLSEEQKIAASLLVRLAGAHFVKTSTGFVSGGATVADVGLLRRAVGPTFGVKASGGIRDRNTAEQMIAAGADRIGTSSGVVIVGS